MRSKDERARRVRSSSYWSWSYPLERDWWVLLHNHHSLPFLWTGLILLGSHSKPDESATSHNLLALTLFIFENLYLSFRSIFWSLIYFWLCKVGIAECNTQCQSLRCILFPTFECKTSLSYSMRSGMSGAYHWKSITIFCCCCAVVVFEDCSWTIVDPPFGLNKGSGIFVNTVGTTWDFDPFFNPCSIAITRTERVFDIICVHMCWFYGSSTDSCCCTWHDWRHGH